MQKNWIYLKKYARINRLKEKIKMQNKKNTIILALFTLLSLIINIGTAQVHAIAQINSEPSANLESENAETSENLKEAVKQNSLLVQLEKKLAQSIYRHKAFVKNVDQAEDALLEVQASIRTLKNEVGEFELQIKLNGKDQLSVESQKEKKLLELDSLKKDADALNAKLSEQKTLVESFFKILYLKQSIYFEKNGDPNAIKMLANPDGVSDSILDFKYIKLLEKESKSQIQKMVEMTKEISKKQLSIEKKRKDLKKLESALDAKQAEIQNNLNEKLKLLEETKSEEAMLEAMVNSKDKKEKELLKEIDIYKKNVDAMQNAINGVRGSLSESESEIVEKIYAEMSLKVNSDEASDFLQLDWPVDVSKGLSAYFHDSKYKGSFGVDHYAVDIKANQGSPIYAPADGVVSEVSFDPNSTRYAYIKISHRKGISTLYGHVSEVAVQTGDYIERGQVVGATGAMPGSIGAGIRTTGPHLHFEIYQDGVRVDPLDYMPLEEVPAKDLPDSYKNILEKQLADKIKELGRAIKH